MCRRFKTNDEAFLSNDSSFEISSWKPSLSFVNLNGSIMISPSEEIDTVKKAEEGDAYIVRLYEHKNMKSNKVILNCAFPIKRVVETNLIERELEEIPLSVEGFEFSINGYEIKTFKLFL